MDVIHLVFLDVVLPILLLMTLGMFLQKKFDFHLRTITKLITYCFMPAAVFLNISQSAFDYQLMGQLFLYLLLFMSSLMLLGTGLAKLLKLETPERAALKNSISLMNAGNYGLPISQLIFSANPLGVRFKFLLSSFKISLPIRMAYTT